MALGPYRHRLLVELAQNAADAARRAGVPGRLRLALRDDKLVAANTGAPLDLAGVESLCTLRASAKRADPGATGRFGVGFAAVRTVSDSPSVRSTAGGVQWSVDRALDELAGVPPLAPELAARGRAVPALRLPFPEAAAPPAGFDTAVVLPLRNEPAVAAVRRELADLDPVLLLSLPGLAEVAIDSRLMTASRTGSDVAIDDDGEVTRWRVVRRSGRLTSALLADRPTEEQARGTYQVTCAVPLGGPAGHPDAEPVRLPSSVPAVLRAPTLTDEPLSLPAVVIGSWPLDSGRRRVAPGPLTDALIAAAAAAYGDLVRAVATSPAALDLVPAGLAAAELDGALRRAILQVLVETPFLPLAADPSAAVRPRDAVAVDPGAVTAVLADVLPNVLPAEWAARVGPLAVLGVRRLGLPDVVDALAGLRRPAAWWRRLYLAFGQGHLGGPERDVLGALPVPLADGRIRRGPRGLLLPGPGLDSAAVAALDLALDLAVVHPDAVAPLLTLLGAVAATPASLLADPRVQAAVAASFDAEDPAPIADAVLGLVRAAGPVPGELPWLADLALPGADGELYPAGELVLPGGDFAAVLVADAPFGRADAELVQRWGAATLTAVGVLDGFAVLREADVPVDPAAADHDLDAEADWLADLLDRLPGATGTGDRAEAAPPVLAELVAVRDLELVRPDAWDRALGMLPRRVLTEPALVVLPDGRRVRAVPYTRWWLARSPVIDGRRPADLTPAGSDLAGLYDEAPPWADTDLLLALGVRSGVEAVLAEPGGAAELLDRLGSDRPVDRGSVRRLHARLALGPAPEPGHQPPARVRAVRHGVAVAVAPADAVVVDAPDLLPLVAPLAVVPAPVGLATEVADLLDVALASELGSFAVVSAGVPDSCRYGRYLVHDRLLVADADGRPTAAAWRVTDGEVHLDAAAGPDGLGRAFAWREGRWAQRWLHAAVLRDPAAAQRWAAEQDLDGPD